MDNFFRLFGRREVPAPTVTITTTSPDDASNQPQKSGNWEANVVHPYGKQSLLVPAWYRGVSLRMQTMGQVSVQYQRRNQDGGNFVEDRYGKNGTLNYLLQVRPNPVMTAAQLQEQIEYRKIYFGNAYVYIERGMDGYPVALWLCTNGCYDPITDRYVLTYNSNHGPRVSVQVPSADVLHFKNVFLSDDGYTGLPTLDFAMKSLSIAATADDQALQDMAKGGKYKILIQEEKDPANGGTRGRANQKELKKITEQFNEDWLANDAVLLNNVADAKVISQTSQQLQLLEQRSFQVSDLARILGIPRIMMMDGDGGSYKMPEHATQEFLLRTIQPVIREWEDEMNSKLLTAEDFGKRRIHVCELPLRRLDAKGQADIDKLHLEAGWSPNEIRAQYDLPAIPEGDAHYVSTNLAEVGSEKLKSNGGGRPTEDGSKPTAAKSPIDSNE